MRRKDRQIININDIESIISRSDVCRIAFADNNYPYIVTMNFGYSGGDNPCLYFHCASEGKKLEMIRKNNYVCFEMDSDHEIYEGEKGCDWGMKFSSVVGFGNISILKDRHESIEGLNRIMAHYSDRKNFSYDEKILLMTKILKLDIQEMTAKRK
jgi:uncharacterized protein